MRNHRWILLVVATLVVFLAISAGCSRQDSADGNGRDSAQQGSEGYMDVMTRSHRNARKMANITPLQQEIKQFQALKGRYPRSLQELEKWRGSELPEPPRDMTYSYNPETGQIQAVPKE